MVDAQENAAELDAATASLRGLAGQWVGTTRTWFEPQTVADESAITARIRPIGLSAGGADGADGVADDAGGFVLYEYSATLGGEAYEGVAIVGVDGNTGGLVSAWVDGFHMNKAIMLSKGAAPAASAAFDLVGSYADPDGGPPWGWRTEFAMPDGASGNRLIVTAYNIAPDGTEAKALESAFVRR